MIFEDGLVFLTMGWRVEMSLISKLLIPRSTSAFTGEGGGAFRLDIYAWIIFVIFFSIYKYVAKPYILS